MMALLHTVTNSTFTEWSTILAVLLAAILTAIGFAAKAVIRWRRSVDEGLEHIHDHEVRIQSLELDRDLFHPRRSSPPPRTHSTRS